MRKVSDIKTPAIGMHIGWFVGGGDAESERRYGLVTGIDETPSGTRYHTSLGEDFEPSRGDEIFYYGATAKGGKVAKNPEAIAQREIAYKDRAAVRGEMSTLRNRNYRWKIAALLGWAVLTVYVILNSFGVIP